MTDVQVWLAASLATIAVVVAALPLSRRIRGPVRREVGVAVIAAVVAALIVALFGDGFGPYIESVCAAFLTTAALTCFAQTRQESRLAMMARLTAIVVLVSGAVLALQV